MMRWCEWDGMMGNEGGRLELLYRLCGLEELWAENNGVFEGWTWTLHVLCKARALIAFWATMSMPGCINPLVQVGGTVLILLSSHERHCSTLGKWFKIYMSTWGCLKIWLDSLDFSKHFRFLGLVSRFLPSTFQVPSTIRRFRSRRFPYPLLQIVDGRWGRWSPQNHPVWSQGLKKGAILGQCSVDLVYHIYPWRRQKNGTTRNLKTCCQSVAFFGRLRQWQPHQVLSRLFEAQRPQGRSVGSGSLQEWVCCYTMLYCTPKATMETAWEHPCDSGLGHPFLTDTQSTGWSSSRPTMLQMMGIPKSSIFRGFSMK